MHNPFKETRKTLSYWLLGLYKLAGTQSKVNFAHFLINKLTAKGENFLDVCLLIHEMCLSDKEMLTMMVKQQIVGRLMANIVKDKDKFKGLLEVTAPESEIGYEEHIEKSLLEELRLKKLRMQDNENEYIWGLICHLINYA